MTKGMSSKKNKPFMDRESGVFGDLMLALKDYSDRLTARLGYQLNKKPRQKGRSSRCEAWKHAW